eukprot:scaffold46368_cov37-Phaeocystis_antarctica.AAC.1
MATRHKPHTPARHAGTPCRSVQQGYIGRIQRLKYSSQVCAKAPPQGTLGSVYIFRGRAAYRADCAARCCRHPTRPHLVRVRVGVRVRAWLGLLTLTLVTNPNPNQAPSPSLSSSKAFTSK